MKKIYTDYLIRLKEKKKTSFDAMQDPLGISASTLCRYFKGDAEPTLDTLERIVEYLGGSMRELYAQVGESEMIASEKVDFKGADALLEEFSRREAAYKENCEQRLAHAVELRRQLQHSFDEAIATLERTHADALKKRDETYERSASYLKDLVTDLKADNKELRERAATAEAERAELDRRRHHVFWCMFGLLAAVILLFAGAIVADLPQIGMGW